MLRVNPIQNSFTAGELSPWLMGRSDIDRYFTGGEKLENFMIRNQGGITFRPGSRNAGRAASQTAGQNIRLVDFVFSREDAICVEVSAAKFRFLRAGAFLGAPLEVTVVYGTATAVPYANADINELDFTQSADVIYIAHPDYPPATLSRYSDADWRYEIINFDYGPFQDQEPGEQDYSLHVTTPIDRMTLTSATTDDFLTGYAAASLIEYSNSGQKFLALIKTKTSNTVLQVEPKEDFCFSMAPEVYSPGVYTGWDSVNNVPTYSQDFSDANNVSVAFSATGVAVREMIGGYLRFTTKAGVNHWMLVDSVEDIVNQMAYGIIAKGDIITTTVQVPSGIITRSNRTIKAVLYSSASNFFNTTTHLGRKYRLVLNGKVIYATTRANDAAAPYSEPSNSGQNMAVNLDRPLPRSIEGFSVVDLGTTNEWNRGSWYIGNYPTAVGFHEERLCFAGTVDEPQTGWLSKTADFYNFATTDYDLRVLDNSAITFTVASNTVNQILWVASHGDLIVGTVGGEYAIRPSSSGKPLTATNISAKAQTSYGVAYAKPLQVGKSLISIQRGSKKLRQMSPDTDTGRRNSLDLTVFADHLFRDNGTAQQLAYQLLPESVVYVRTSSGQVAALAYEEDQQVYAWSRFVFGGPSVVVESIACVPHSSEYYLYLVVSRTIDGANVRTIEYIRPDFTIASTTDWDGFVAMDNYKTGTLSGAVTTITSLTDYESAEVVCQVGTLFMTGTVSASGVLTLSAAIQAAGTNGKTYRVGFAYTGWFKAFPPEVQNVNGTAQGKVKRISNMVVRVKDTTNFSHGIDTANLRFEDFAQTSDAAGAPPPHRTEDVRISFDNGLDTRAAFSIKQTQPYPLSILSIMPEFGVYGS